MRATALRTASMKSAVVVAPQVALTTGAHHDRRFDKNDGRAATEATWVGPHQSSGLGRETYLDAHLARMEATWGGVRGAVSVGRCPNMTNFSRCRRGTMTDAVRRPAETRSICRKGRLLHPGSVGDCGDC
jgi:hypothetical protein